MYIYRRYTTKSRSLWSRLFPSRRTRNLPPFQHFVQIGKGSMFRCIFSKSLFAHFVRDALLVGPIFVQNTFLTCIFGPITCFLVYLMFTFLTFPFILPIISCYFNFFKYSPLNCLCNYILRLGSRVASG
jgi:hypothetical protein